MQLPPMQKPKQNMPQPPQLDGSDWVSSQPLPQQASPPPQVSPQDRQLVGVPSITQLPPQHC